MTIKLTCTSAPMSLGRQIVLLYGYVQRNFQCLIRNSHIRLASKILVCIIALFLNLVI